MSYPPAYDRLIARTYDAVYGVLRDPSGDAAFYRGLAEEAGGPVLELGCGTGRVLLPIAALGIPCVGVDASPAMLEVLRDKGPPPNVALVESRFEDLALGERRFRLITAPFRAFQHLLTVETQLGVLAKLRSLLEPGGRLAFDVFDPNLERLAGADGREQLGATFLHDGKTMRRWEAVRAQLDTQVLHVRFRFEGDDPAAGGTVDLELRWFYRYEVEHLLVRAGFSDVAFYGDYQRGPWRAQGETVVVARPSRA